MARLTPLPTAAFCNKLPLTAPVPGLSRLRPISGVQIYSWQGLIRYQFAHPSIHPLNIHPEFSTDIYTLELSADHSGHERLSGEYRKILKSDCTIPRSIRFTIMLSSSHSSLGPSAQSTCFWILALPNNAHIHLNWFFFLSNDESHHRLPTEMLCQEKAGLVKIRQGTGTLESLKSDSSVYFFFSMFIVHINER